MRRAQAIFLLFMTIIGAAAGAAGTSVEKQIDEIFSDFSAEGVPSASVLVTKDGRVVYRKSFGGADLERGDAATPTTNYRLASVTKQFTAMAVMILRERGLLSYDSAVSSILPEFPAYGRKITVRNLLQHTSGLPEYSNHLPPGQKDQLRDRDVLDILRRQRGLLFAPGTRYKYNNSGYAVLALIVERIANRPYAEFLRDEVFLPAGMTRSIAFIANEGPEIQERAYGYTPTKSGFVRTDQHLTSAVLGDGGIYSSIDDLEKWHLALSNNTLVRPETLAEAFTPGRLIDGSSIGYGFGWRIDTARGSKRIHHTGHTIGFSSVVQRYIAHGITVTILTNRREAPAAALADRVVSLLL